MCFGSFFRTLADDSVSDFSLSETVNKRIHSERKDERNTTSVLQSIEKLYGVCTETMQQKQKLTKLK